MFLRSDEIIKTNKYMLDKVKKWLGIEGVKLELILPETVQESNGAVTGQIRLFSMSPQRVSAIKVKMVERYSRGRKQDKLTDEYVLGIIEFRQELTIPKEEYLDIEFTLPFEMKKSEMDTIGDNNPFIGGLVKLAKSFEGVQSTYFIQAEANVVGTGLNPFDKQMILLE